MLLTRKFLVCPKNRQKASKATAVQYFIAGKAKSLQNYLFTVLLAKKRVKEQTGWNKLQRTHVNCLPADCSENNLSQLNHNREMC